MMPWANTFLIEKSFMPGSVGDMSLVEYYPIILTFLVIFTGSQLSGTIFGFLILSDKDDQTIKALMVTPMSSKKYVKNRVISSCIVGSFFILLLFYMVGINVGPFWKMAFISIGGGLTAPLIMLFLGITSEGKVQGMNNGKMFGVFGIILVISWFVKSNFQYLFGILPYYWVSKAYWQFESGNMWLLYILIGICYQLVIVWAMTKLFNKKLYKTF